MAKDLYRLAEKRVQKKRAFYRHLTSYVIMGAFFFTLNMLTDPWDWWFYWPMLGWGIGLAFHYVGTFGLPGLGLDEKWEQRELEKEMRRLGIKERPAPPAPEEDHLDLDQPERFDLNKAEPEKRKNWNEGDLV